jgi:uncharacterized protein (TIGR02271 family)
MIDRPEADLVLPLAEERAVVHKEVIETGRVRISTHVEKRRELVEEALRHDDVVVERVVINQPVETPPAIRQEGDVLIYPIVEEELVVTKRLILKEELRISRKTWSEPATQEVTLRSVTATVERTAAPDLPST